MASLTLLRPFTFTTLSRPLLYTTLFTTSSALLVHQHLRSRPLLADSFHSSSPLSGYKQNAQTPVVASKKGINPAAIKQISAGSIFGLVGGLAVSVFSKPLAILLGLLVVGLQFIESRGIHIIPYNTLQRRFRSIDARGLILNNVAFKMSFGLTFALAAFAEF